MAAPKKDRLAGPSRPLGAPDIPQFHLPGSGPGVWAPRLYGAAAIRFADRRRKIDETRRVAFLVALDPASSAMSWDEARATPVTPADLVPEPPVRAAYLPLPAGAMQLKTFTRWAKNFDRWLARTQRLPLPAAGEGEAAELGPRRGGVSVELVAIVWELAPA